MTEPKTKSDKTRAQIIEGAQRALSQTGVMGTTTRKIAAEAGVRLSTLHYHFDSKSALLVAVLEAVIDEATQTLRQQIKNSTSLDDCIERLLHAAWRSVTQARTMQIVQYELTLYALREGAEWLAEQQYESYIRLYRDHLMTAPIESERLSPSACTALARFMLAGVDGLILQELAKSNTARSKRGIDALIASAQSYAKVLASGS
jgi:AcrR family transcriptional regulator